MFNSDEEIMKIIDDKKIQRQLKISTDIHLKLNNMIQKLIPKLAFNINILESTNISLNDYYKIFAINEEKSSSNDKDGYVILENGFKWIEKNEFESDYLILIDDYPSESNYNNCKFYLTIGFNLCDIIKMTNKEFFNNFTSNKYTGKDDEIENGYSVFNKRHGYWTWVTNFEFYQNYIEILYYNNYMFEKDFLQRIFNFIENVKEDKIPDYFNKVGAYLSQKQTLKLLDNPMKYNNDSNIIIDDISIINKSFDNIKDKLNEILINYKKQKRNKDD